MAIKIEETEENKAINNEFVLKRNELKELKDQRKKLDARIYAKTMILEEKYYCIYKKTENVMEQDGSTQVDFCVKFGEICATECYRESDCGVEKCRYCKVGIKRWYQYFQLVDQYIKDNKLSPNTISPSKVIEILTILNIIEKKGNYLESAARLISQKIWDNYRNSK